MINRKRNERTKDTATALRRMCVCVCVARRVKRKLVEEKSRETANGAISNGTKGGGNVDIHAKNALSTTWNMADGSISMCVYVAVPH